MVRSQIAAPAWPFDRCHARQEIDWQGRLIFAADQSLCKLPSETQFGPPGKSCAPRLAPPKTGFDGIPGAVRGMSPIAAGGILRPPPSDGDASFRLLNTRQSSWPPQRRGDGQPYGR